MREHTSGDKAHMCLHVQVIEAALLKKQLQPHRDALRMQASSRTDSGVHAECQVISPNLAVS